LSNSWRIIKGDIKMIEVREVKKCITSEEKIQQLTEQKAKDQQRARQIVEQNDKLFAKADKAIEEAGL
jgi:hypothetical protein